MVSHLGSCSNGQNRDHNTDVCVSMSPSLCVSIVTAERAAQLDVDAEMRKDMQCVQTAHTANMMLWACYQSNDFYP